MLEPYTERGSTCFPQAPLFRNASDITLVIRYREWLSGYKARLLIPGYLKTDMRLFTCSHCNNTLYFENTRCMVCGLDVGFHTRRLTMISLTRDGDNGHYLNSEAPLERLRYCDNRNMAGCNWLVDADSHERFCVSCQLNKTIPNLSIPENTARWKDLEAAKKRLIYSLLKLKLPFKQNTPLREPGLQFEFLSNEFSDKPVFTGHLNGIITINIEEADEIQRHIIQLQMGEKYRTVLGHFRHEVGHYYWNRLVRDAGFIPQFRTLFGNEGADYPAALERYYQKNAPPFWEEDYISEYASSHPWEDWAETWANYLHIMDSLETAWSFGIQLRPAKGTLSGMTTDVPDDPYCIEDFQRIIAAWLPLSIAVNNLNRSMGHKDFYTFYLSPKVVEKLAFVHNLCRLWGRQFS